ncbi:MAG: efflux RND transporter permease subunit [bacterium]|nr:efflux RND transporter permease subunit [bacterium]
MSIINLSVKRPVGTIMFYVGIILLGIISYTKLAINLLPDLSFPKITVVTRYPGSGPEEIERFITSQLEGPLAAIKGVKKIDSLSQEGVSIITLEYHWGTDMDFALLHTKEKTEEVRSRLPDDHEAPIIMEMDPSASPIMIAIISSETVSLRDQKETAEFIIKPRLEQLEGISAVEIRGGDVEEISVEIDPEKIKSLGITLSAVSAAIRVNNDSPFGGTVKKDKFRYTLKIEGELKTPKEIESIVVHNLQGRNVLVKDIGRAFYKNKLRDGDIRFDATPAISLLLYRESGGNTVKATKAAEKAIQGLEKELEGIRFSIVAKEAQLIIASINSLKYSLLLGAVLAIFILLLFLQNYRDPLLVSVVIPISIVATFVLMFFFDVQVNIMSLGGLVLGVGMFVDNCIIVLESIFRHRDKEKLIPSVINGAKEVGGAITASTFTTISIFLPVIYLYGVTGKLFRDQALTVSFSLISSLVVAITLLPALSAIKAVFKTRFTDDTPSAGTGEKKWHFPLKGLNFILLVPFKIIGYIIYFILAGIFLLFKYTFKYLGILLNLILKPLYKIFNRLYTTFDNFYHRVLETILNRKIIALYLSIFILASILGTFLLLNKELLPAPESNKFEINANTVPAYGFEETNRIAYEIEKKLMAVQDVEFVFTESGAVSQEAGRSEDISVNSLHFIVNCRSPEIRPKIMAQAREILTNTELQDFSLSLEQNTLSQYLATGGDNFQVKVFYDDIEKGKEAVRRVVEQVRNFPELQDLKTTTTEGKPTYAITFKQDLLNQLNITKDYISSFINQAVRGERAGEIRLVQKNYDIYVRVPVDGIMAMNRLMNLPMPINNTTYFLKDLIEIETRPSVKRIEKERQNMFFLVSADAPSGSLDKIIKKTEERLENLDLPTNTRAVIAGEEEERRKAFDSLNQAIWLAIILVYMIMAAKFENIVQPLIIMFTVPMGLIGAFLILLISGNTLNIISGIGIMVLIGIGVNDAIVKIEYSNQLRKDGMAVREAVMTASRVRLRPILMTTLTTIFGVLPMALMKQTGSELQRPLALVIIGGLLFTTLLTLLLIPVFYEMLENFKEKKKEKK